MQRFQGIKGDTFGKERLSKSIFNFADKEAIRNCRSSSEGGKNFVWFRGKNKVSIVDCEDLKNFTFTDILLSEGRKILFSYFYTFFEFSFFNLK